MSKPTFLLAAIVVVLLCISAASAQLVVDCEEIEIDFGFSGHASFTGLRQNFVPGTTTVIVLQTTVQSQINVEVTIASDQSGFALLSPDNVTLTYNGISQTQVYAQFGNYFPVTLNFVPLQATTNTTIVVFVNQSSNTSSCNATYTFIVVNPGPSNAGLVVGDPQFVGLRGQSYQIHGIDGAVYNLFSDKAFQLNSRFTFLTGPRSCPIVPSTRQRAASCWSHPGSYISEIGLKVAATGEEIFIAAGTAIVGFSATTVNGKSLKVGDSSSTYSFNSTHEMTLSFGPYTLEVENSDLFLNIRSVRVAIDAWPTLSSHGLLGQTWSTTRHSGKISAIEGEVDDYMITEDSLFGDSFLFNKYK